MQHLLITFQDFTTWTVDNLVFGNQKSGMLLADMTPGPHRNIDQIYDVITYDIYLQPSITCM